MSQKNALSSVRDIRERARQDLEKAAVTEASDQSRAASKVQMLNDALATELVCALRYKRHYYMASGVNSRNVAQEFAEHANEELEHAHKLAARIVQLGGAPDFSPKDLANRAHSEYVEATTLKEMLRENLVAERIAIQTYREMISTLSDDDPTTRRMMEDILMVEEEHADDLASFLDIKDQ
jgi:bacterioferritin